MTDTTSAPGPVRELPLAAGGTVEIHVTAGNLRIRGSAEDRVVVRSRDGDPLGDDVAVEAEPDVVRIRDGRWGFQLGSVLLGARRSRDLDIELPLGAHLNVRTLSGDVEAVGLAGPSRWASASGDLRIATAAGPIQVETMSGSATLEITGAIDLGARSVSGDLRIRAPRLDTTDIGTTSGDIRLEAELAAGARHAVSSVSGDVEITTSSPVRLEAKTIAGDVRAKGAHSAEGGRGHRTIVVGDGSVALSVRTTSGNVQLRAIGAGEARTADDARIAGRAPATSSGFARGFADGFADKFADGFADAFSPGERPVAAEAPVAPAPPVTPAPPFAPAPPVAPQPPDAPAAPALAPVAEAVAGIVRPRDLTEEDTQAWNAPTPVVDRREAARLDILRALERGELDIEGASRRLELLEDAGPRSFRGWC